VTGAARLTPGRGSSFVQRGGAIRPPGCENTGGATRLTWRYGLPDWSPIEFLGRREDKKCPELCPRTAFWSDNSLRSEVT
jgi:hypothetical protein